MIVAARRVGLGVLSLGSAPSVMEDQARLEPRAGMSDANPRNRGGTSKCCLHKLLGVCLVTQAITRESERAWQEALSLQVSHSK